MINKRGFAALSAVLLVSAVITAVIVTVTMLAIGEGQAALSIELGGNDQYLVDGCAEDIMQKIHDNSATNITSITRPEGTCVVSYNLGGPTNWDITIKEAGIGYGKIVRIVFTRGAKNIISSWKEN